MSSEIEIRVVARDQTGAALTSAETRTKKLAGAVDGGTGSLGGAYESAGRKAGGFAGSLRRIGEVAAGVLVADALQAGARRAVALIQQTVKAASDLGESVNAVNKVFGASSATVLQWGKDNANSIGLSTRAFNQMATPLGSMLKNQGLAMGEVTTHTIKLTQRASDMASVFNTDVGAALTAIQAGLRGESDPLERFGVGLSAVAVEARALADTGKESAIALTTQEKALARLNLIYDQTKDTAGDFRDTADGLANSQRIATATIEEAQAKIGVAFIPVMAKAAQVSGQFAETLTALPQPVVLVTAAALGLGAAVLIAAPRIMATKEALDKMGQSSSRTVRTVQGLAVGVGRATAILGTLATVSQIVGSAIGDQVNPQVEALTKGLVDWSKGGKLAGESARILGDDMGHLDDMMALVSSNGFEKTIVRMAENVSATDGLDDSLSNTESRVAALDQAMVSLVQNGQSGDAAAIFAKLSEEATRMGVSIDTLKAGFPAYAAAVEVAAKGTNTLGSAAQITAANVDEMTKSFDAAFEKTFSLEEVQDKAADAIANLTEKVKEQVKAGDEGALSLTANTQAARDNRAAVRDLVGDYREMIVQANANGESTVGMAKTLEDQLVDMGFARAEAQRYTQQLGELTAAIAAIPPMKTVTIQVRAQGASYLMSGGTAALLGRAHGGITGAESGGVRGGWTMTGERGRELVKLPYGSTVIPHGTTESLLSGASGGAGRSSQSQATEMRFSGDVDSAFATAFMNLIRTGKITIASKAVV